MARKTVVEDGVSGIYHCISRCVRRAFLCGFDSYSGKDYEHRKFWIRDRLEELSHIFGVEVLSYATMSNHLHLVLRTMPHEVSEWEASDVARRWARLFPAERDDQGRALPAMDAWIEHFCEDAEQVAQCRERLASLSWFMRCLNEPLARRTRQGSPSPR